MDQFQGLNFQAFAVLVDATGSVWAGTPAGLNRSEDGGRSWYRYDVYDGFPGNWVISIEEQPRRGRDPAIWATTWPGRGDDNPQRFGAVVTGDRGKSFRSVLHGDVSMTLPLTGLPFTWRARTVYSCQEMTATRSEPSGNSMILRSPIEP